MPAISLCNVYWGYWHVPRSIGQWRCTLLVHVLSLACECCGKAHHFLHVKSWYFYRNILTFCRVLHKMVCQSFLPSWRSGSFELSKGAQLACLQTLLIQLRLATITVTLHTQVLFEYLHEYFSRSQLSIITLPFDLGSNISLTNWSACMATVLAKLPTSIYCHVIITVTNHTNCNTRDLFLSQDELGRVIAALVDEVSVHFSSKHYISLIVHPDSF